MQSSAVEMVGLQCNYVTQLRWSSNLITKVKQSVVFVNKRH